MTALDATIKPLPPERSTYMQWTAAQAVKTLERFASDPVEFHPTALQLLDEWIDRATRDGPLSSSARVLAVAFLGQTFLFRHGGYWAAQMRDQKQNLGVVCPVAGPGDVKRFIDIADQVNRRLVRGIADSLTFFYLTVSVDLQGRS